MKITAISVSDLNDLKSDATAAHLTLFGHVVPSSFAVSESWTASAFPDSLETVEEFDFVCFVFHISNILQIGSLVNHLCATSSTVTRQA